MKPEVLRVGTAAAVGLALGLSLATGGALQARQDPPAAQQKPAEVDALKLTTNVPTLIVSFIKPEKAAEFESAWVTIRDVFAKTDRPEVKEFAATFSKFSKVEATPGAPPTAPVIYVFQLDSPSQTQTYHPLRMVYEFLYYIKDGKEGGIPRAQADEIAAKLKDAYVTVYAWQLGSLKTGS